MASVVKERTTRHGVADSCGVWALACVKRCVCICVCACVRMCADVYTCGACRRRVHVRTHSMLCSLLDHATSARMHSVPAHSAVDQLRTPFDPAMQTMVLAGSDTTATTLAFALAELARHPEIAAAAAAEVEELIGNRDPAALGADVYQSRLPWVTAIANETLRL